MDKGNMDSNINARPFYQPIIMGSAPFRISCCKTTDFPAHWHGDIEILYVLPHSDDVCVTADGKTYKLSGRSAVFISGAVIHSVEVRGGSPTVLLIEFGTAFMGDCFSAFSGKRFSDPVIDFSNNDNESTKRMEKLLLMLSDICLENGNPATEEKFLPAVRMRISSCLFELAALMAENMEMTSSERRM